MSNYVIGEDAFNDTSGSSESSDVEWTKLNSGMSYKVRAFKNYTQAVMKFRNYGIYKVINSFSAKNPSIKDDKGFAKDKLTPWDKASQYYAELLFEAMDKKDEVNIKKYKAEASKYREKERFAVAFGDLETGLPVHFDISPKQWRGIRDALNKYKDNLDSISFELSKTGTGTGTVVSLMPIMTNLEPLTEKEQANFDKFDDYEFDPSVFKSFMYEIDEDEQIQNLIQAGFDISLIGLEAPKGEASAEQPTEEGEEGNEPEFDF